MNHYTTAVLASKPIQPKSALNYRLISFFSLSNIYNLSLYLHNHIHNNSSNQLKGTFRSSKILIKQSYVLLVWLSSVFRSGKFKNSFAFLPKKRSLQTLLKAPMAHKTFSQEQFNFMYTPVTVTVTAKGFFSPNNYAACYLASLVRGNNLSVGTNLLFIARVKNSFASKDPHYFLIT